MGWQGAGGGSKCVPGCQKAALLESSSFATDFSRAGISVWVELDKGACSCPTQAQLLLEMGVLLWFGAEIWGLELIDKSQSHGKTGLCSTIFAQTKVLLKARRH